MDGVGAHHLAGQLDERVRAVALEQAEAQGQRIVPWCGRVVSREQRPAPPALAESRSCGPGAIRALPRPRVLPEPAVTPALPARPLPDLLRRLRPLPPTLPLPAPLPVPPRVQRMHRPRRPGPPRSPSQRPIFANSIRPSLCAPSRPCAFASDLCLTTRPTPAVLPAHPHTAPVPTPARSPNGSECRRIAARPQPPRPPPRKTDRCAAQIRAVVACDR